MMANGESWKAYYSSRGASPLLRIRKSLRRHICWRGSRRVRETRTAQRATTCWKVARLDGLSTDASSQWHALSLAQCRKTTSPSPGAFPPLLRPRCRPRVSSLRYWPPHRDGSLCRSASRRRRRQRWRMAPRSRPWRAWGCWGLYRRGRRGWKGCEPWQSDAGLACSRSSWQSRDRCPMSNRWLFEMRDLAICQMTAWEDGEKLT